MLGLPCGVQAPQVVAPGSRVHGLGSCSWGLLLVVVCVVSYPTACVSQFLNQGSNPCPLSWKADS